MGFTIDKENYAGSIRKISIGKGDKAVTVGGQSCYSFYGFEGDIPNRPKIAMEIWDMTPEEWPEAALTHFKDVVSDPAAWAKKCVNEFGAEIIVLQLKSIDPNDRDASPEEAVSIVKKVLDAIDVPLVVWGCAAPAKDEEVFKAISEQCQGANLILSPIEEKNHKGIGASAIGYGHTIGASSPIDVNLAKQLNILLENLGMPTDRMIIDPTTGGLGYGLEYSYSVMERIRIAAMTQGDDKLQFPIINNLGNEIWKCKEAKLTPDQEPTLGDPEARGILMEAVAAVAYLMAGSDILIMRHPESIRLVKSFIDLGIDGGTAFDVESIQKKMEKPEIDFVKFSFEPDLTLEQEKAKTEPIKQEIPKSKPAEVAKDVQAKPPVEKQAEQESKEQAEQESKEQAEKEAKEQAEKEAKEQAKIKEQAEKEAEKQVKLKEQAEQEAKEQAKLKEQAAKEAKEKAMLKAKADKEAEERAKAEQMEQELREKRAKEKDEISAERQTIHKLDVKITPAAIQRSQIDKLVDQLDRIHKRVA